MQQKPFGLWPSPFSPKLLSQERRLLDAQWDPGSRQLVWLEGRSDRTVLVQGSTHEAPREMTSELVVRAKVGYGGGDFSVTQGAVLFAEAKSGKLYRQSLYEGPAQPLTPGFGHCASPRATPDGRTVTYVHHDDAGVDRLAVVDGEGKQWPRILHQGHDFYAYNRVSPDGALVAFIAWDHPNMPWDGTWLYLMPLAGGEARRVAGGKDVAVIQPEFSPDGKTLYYISDESGMGNLHALDLASGKTRAVTAQKRYDLGRPAWVQDSRVYGLVPEDDVAIVCANEQGFTRVASVDLASGKLKVLPAFAPYTDVVQIDVHPRSGMIAVVGSSPGFGPRVAVSDRHFDDALVIARATTEAFAPETLAKPEALAWPTAGGEKAYGLFYPPTNPGFTSTGLPPLVVLVHGGPTSQARAGWSPQAQFFATRGYGVLYVNHRGSTGYGREYMLKLRGTWGKVDVEDAVSGAQFLAASGRVDGARTVIMGGSAGGYTVLQTMVDQPEAFAAGICLYGIANQFSLLASTHKFEAHYSDSLLGVLPEAAALYRERSPVLHAHKIKRPLAVFQGADDVVVPRAQSDAIVKALQRNGTPHTYKVYDGEGHGWRKAETIEHFYGAVDEFLKEQLVYA
jgi:dipeptidyl aminopeptidase/acylaminoacyl peptidase